MFLLQKFSLLHIFNIIFFFYPFLESDANKDRLISYDEFLTETKKDEFDEDPGWETMDMQVNMFFFHSAMFCLLATLNYICDQKLKHNGQKFSTVVIELKKTQNEHLNSESVLFNLMQFLKTFFGFYDLLFDLNGNYCS